MVLNLTANASIGYSIPMQVLTGVTQDISPILQFEWYEPIYYKMEESHFPSMSNEKSGRFVGISEHVGHAMTFMILTDDTQKIIHRSVIRSALNPESTNIRASNYPDSDPHPHIQSFIDNHPTDTNEAQPRMPIIYPEELVGKLIGLTQEDGQTTQLRIIEAIQEHEDDVNNVPTNVKFRYSMNDDAYEDILMYNQVMDYSN